MLRLPNGLPPRTLAGRDVLCHLEQSQGTVAFSFALLLSVLRHLQCLRYI